jgi:hypothetical protein
MVAHAGRAASTTVDTPRPSGARKAALCCIAAFAVIVATGPAAASAHPPSCLILRADYLHPPHHPPRQRWLSLHAPQLPSRSLFSLQPLRWEGELHLGTPERHVHLDSAVSIDNDYPILGGRLRVRWARGWVALKLPSLQAVPRVFYGTFGVELRVNLLATRF